MLPELARGALFRVDQEAVRTVVQHANARQVWTSLAVDAEHLTLEVQDDGHGFVVPKNWLGIETQRQWTMRAIGRTTPCLFGCVSLVVLLDHALHPEHLPPARPLGMPGRKLPTQTPWPQSIGTSGSVVIGQLHPPTSNDPIPSPISSPIWSKPPATLPNSAKVELTHPALEAEGLLSSRASISTMS